MVYVELFDGSWLMVDELTLEETRVIFTESEVILQPIYYHSLMIH